MRLLLEIQSCELDWQLFSCISITWLQLLWIFNLQETPSLNVIKYLPYLQYSHQSTIPLCGRGCERAEASRSVLQLSIDHYRNPSSSLGDNNIPYLVKGKFSYHNPFCPFFKAVIIFHHIYTHLLILVSGVTTVLTRLFAGSGSKRRFLGGGVGVAAVARV